jgi:hypothetical protein
MLKGRHGHRHRQRCDRALRMTDIGPGGADEERRIPFPLRAGTPPNNEPVSPSGEFLHHWRHRVQVVDAE